MIFDSDMGVQEAYLQHIIEHLPIDRFKAIFKINGDFDEDDYVDFLSPVLSDFTILSYEEFKNNLEEIDCETGLQEAEYDEVMNRVGLEIGDYYDFADEFEDE